MLTGLKHLHSYSAYLVLFFIAVAILYHAYSYFNKVQWNKTSKLTALLGLIFTHIQLLAGLILYSISPYGISNLSGEVMSDSFSRLLALEHPLTMISAIILITIGYSRSKKQIESGLASRAILIFYGLGFLIMLLRIPWQVWPR